MDLDVDDVCMASYVGFDFVTVTYCRHVKVHFHALR